MILPFSQQIDQKPTFFTQKIWKGLKYNGYSIIGYVDSLDRDKFVLFIGCEVIRGLRSDSIKPKITTIREDKNNRWKVGMDIHFYINNRTKNMLQFAPVVKIKSLQRIDILWMKDSIFIVIDNSLFDKIPYKSITSGDLETHKDMLQLAINDGFDSIQDFFSYFSKGFSGKIIHWTDLQY